jgi:hypothetical protein
VDKYIKQIQTRMNRRLKSRGQSVTKQQVRDVYLTVVKDSDKPTDVEMSRVIELLAHEVSTQEENVKDDLVVSGSVEIPTPGTIEITPDSHPSHPDVWETLQPPAEEPQPIDKPAPEASSIAPIPQAESTPESALAKSESNLSAQQQPTGAHGGLIPQSEVAGMVNQAFANQPTEIQEQITEYAMQRTFSNVSQVQAFLEQLRGMEFNLLVGTLNDHFQRRGSMLTVLDQVLAGQKQKDDEASQSFFVSFNSRLAAFQKEMESRLSKQGL